MGINEQSQKLMDKIRAKKGKPLFLNTVEAVREANIKQYCTNPPLVEIGRTEDQFVPCLCGLNCIIPKTLEMQGCSRSSFFIMVAVGQSILWRHMIRLSM